MAGVSLGPKKVSLTQDKEGHREYKVTYLVKMTSVDDGPAMALVASGLPLTGSFYALGNEVDTWAFCTPEVGVTQVITEKDRHFWVEKHFTTKPQSRCNETNIENPLLEPAKISGQSDNVSEEATHDRFGQPIHNSAHEQLRGPQVEFDRYRSTVTIEQNYPNMTAITLAYRFLNHCNDRPMWGMGYRQVRLSNVSFSRNFFGLCFPYYTRRLEFTLDSLGFDKNLLDEGTKVLNGHWDEDRNWVLDNIDGLVPDKFNPNHFTRAVDYQGNPIRVVLDGNGKPFVPTDIVDECEQCPPPGGAPEEWTVIGFQDEFGTVPVDANGVPLPHILTHSFGCEWDGNHPVHGPILLSVIGNEWVLDIQGSLQPYTHPTSTWKCHGPNVMTCVSPESFLPKTLAVYSANVPGTIHVEKHPEGNLFLLGVPILL